MRDLHALAAAPLFVAYVYPGWHPSPYRPGLDEWSLLDHHAPYFPGHPQPAEPLVGRYDDRDPATVRRQIAEAGQYGISAFTYFLYFRPDGFVLDEPVWVAASVAAEHPGFAVALTWCIRLPHTSLPLTAEQVAKPDKPGAISMRDEALPPAMDRHRRFIDDLTPGDIENLLEVPDWPALGRHSRAGGFRSQ